MVIPSETVAAEPVIRRGTSDDAEACHGVMWASVTDLGVRHGTPLDGSASDWWAEGESLQRFLATSAAEWWVAEEPESGALIGYARAIARDRLLELTEFFVLPSRQSAGVGRALLERAFPTHHDGIRSIIATTDVRALGRYYRAGTVARFPMLSLVGEPGAAVAGDLRADPIDIDSKVDRRLLLEIDRSVIDYPRSEAEVRWLLGDREGFLYRRQGEVIGYGFVGKRGAGPAAALAERHLPSVLLHLEGRARAAGIERVEFQVPAPNQVATRHLLGRGFRLDPWLNLLMSNRPFGHFDRLIAFGPPVFV